MKYRITSRYTALEYGVYEGETKDEALAAMFEDADFDGEPEPDTWIIEEVEDEA